MTTQEELQALREATRKAHEALRDLKAEHQGIKATIEAWRKEKEAWAAVAEEQFSEIVRQGLDDFGRSLKVAIDDATDRVYKRFDTLADIMMGEEKGDNQEPLAVLVRKWRSGGL